MDPALPCKTRPSFGCWCRGQGVAEAAKLTMSSVPEGLSQAPPCGQLQVWLVLGPAALPCSRLSLGMLAG